MDLPAEPMHYLLIGTAVALGCLLQSAVGFGFGLFVIPVLLLLGLEPQQAIPIVIVNAWAQIVAGMLHHRERLPWAKVAGWSAAAAAALPVGVWLLGLVTTLDAGQIRQVFGVLVLLALFVHWRARPRTSVHPAWAWVAMTAAGLLSGLAAMPGPPIVLWVMAHDWSPNRIRMTTWALFFALAPVTLFVLWARFGEPVCAAVLEGATFLPFTLLALYPGLKLGARLPARSLRVIAYGLLLVICAFSITQPLFGWAG